MTSPPSRTSASSPSSAAKKSDRDRRIARVLWLVLALNIGVAATKLALGAAAGALALVADGLHSSLDASSNVVGLIGIALAARPPDAGHPYGHRRFETLAAAGIGLLIAAGVWEVGSRAIEALTTERPPPDVGWATVTVVAVTVVINLGVSRYEAARGRALGSTLLLADSRHTLSDALAAVAVLASFGAAALGVGWADVVASLIVCGFIAFTAFDVLRSNMGVLADGVQLDPHRVREVAMGVGGVLGAHRIRSRGSADNIHLDLHVQLDPTWTVVDAHHKTHEVAEAIRAAFPEVADVVIHTEPADGRERDLSKVAPSD